MDRISDSGSEDLGSNPDEVTDKIRLLKAALFFKIDFQNTEKL